MADKLVIDIRGVAQLANAVSSVPRQVQRAQSRALASTRRGLLTEAKRDIGREYNLKAGRISKSLTGRTVPAGAAIIGSSRGINAIDFGAKWSRNGRASAGGARYHFKRTSANAAHAGQFIGTGINGAKLVFERDMKRGTHRVGSGYNAGRMKRYLNAVYGPSLAQMLKHEPRPERLATWAMQKLEQEIARQVRLAG